MGGELGEEKYIPAVHRYMSVIVSFVDARPD